MSAAPVPTSSTESAGWGRAGRSGARAAQVGATEPAIDPREVAQVAAQRRRVERAVEEFGRAGRALHVSGPRSTDIVASMRDAGPSRAPGAYFMAMTTTRAPEQTEERSVAPRGWTGRRAPAAWGLGDGQAVPWEYAPAPESRDVVAIQAALRPVHRRPRGRARPTAARSRASTPRPRSRSPRSRRRPPTDVDKAVRAARRAQKRRWGNLPGTRAREVPVPDRPDPPGAVPRVRRPRVDGLGQADQGDRATSTCRSPPTTSGTTRAGRTSSSTRSRAGSRGRSASRRRSSRGTSRC